MNAKLVAVAVAGLFAVPSAQAQTANLTLYGLLNLDMELVRGAFLPAGVAQPPTCTPSFNAVNTCITTNPTQYRVSSNFSRFGIRGTESLGGGLNAIFQVENALPVENSEPPATNRALANRDSYLGLQGSWGTFYAGYYFTPYDKIQGYIWGSLPTQEASILNTRSVWAQAFTSKANGGFDSRLANQIRWDSPVMSGWQGMASYSIGGSATQNEGTPKSNSGTFTGAIFYLSGPILFGTAFQYSEQVRQTGLNDWAFSIAAAYKFPKVRIGAIYERLDYDCANIAGAATACQSVPTSTGMASLTRNFYGVDVTIDVGPGQFYFDWAFSANGGGSVVNGARIAGLAKGDNTSANQWQVSYTYPLSKRTSLYTGYTQILNKSNANYNFATNPYPTQFGIPGVKPQGLVLGMWHSF